MLTSRDQAVSSVVSTLSAYLSRVDGLPLPTVVVLQASDRTLGLGNSRGLEPVGAFAKVRSAGYAESVQQFNMAQSGVAAPVFGPRGTVRHVVCSLAFSSELDDSNVAVTGNAVRRCAEAITLRTGGVLPDGYPFPVESQR